jgi:hypothetical protein
LFIIFSFSSSFIFLPSLYSNLSFGYQPKYHFRMTLSCDPHSWINAASTGSIDLLFWAFHTSIIFIFLVIP